MRIPRKPLIAFLALLLAAPSNPACGSRAGVIGGMLAATVFAVFLVPVFFMVVRRIFPGHARKQPLPSD